MKPYAIGAAVFFVVLAVVLYLINPWGPLLLLASIAIQAPLIFAISRQSFKSSYLDRAWARREQYEKDGDAAAWLAGEQAEERNAGYKYWSRAGRMTNAVNQAAALARLGRGQEAAALLQGVEEKRLSAYYRDRLREIYTQIEQQ